MSTKRASDQEVRNASRYEYIHPDTGIPTYGYDGTPYLTDNHIKQKMGMTGKEVPKELIEFQRLRLRLQREIYYKNKEKRTNEKH